MAAQFRDELKRPATLVAGLFAVLSILIGLFSSIYFYNKSVKAGEISYKVEQILVYQANFDEASGVQKSPISVYDNHQKIIRQNVYAAKLKIWNSGTDEIRKSDIRSPPKIIIDGNVNVLDYTLGFAPSNNIEGFAVAGDGVLSWDHFDPKQGFALTILYAGDQQEKIRINAFIAGIGQPINRAEYQEYFDNELSKMLLILLILLFACAIIWIIFKAWKARKYNIIEAIMESRVGNAFTIAFLIINLLTIVNSFGFFQKIFGIDPRPPF